MTNRKIALPLLVLAVLALGALPAAATSTLITILSNPNEINLGAATQKTVLTGTGSSDSVSLDLGSCSGGNCTLSGVGTGVGLLASKGQYSFSTPANLDVQLTDPVNGVWQVMDSSNDMTFSYSYKGTNELSGVLNMVDFIQVPPSLSNGQDRYVLDAFVTVTGGTLDFKPGMSLQLKYGAVPGYLNSLLGSGNVGSTISTQYGQGTVAPTPEPASVFLLGAGFLLAGGILRARFRRPVSHG
jgi:hypothetical protein